MVKNLSRKITSCILLTTLLLFSLGACGNSTNKSIEATVEPSTEENIAAQDEVTYSGPDVTTIGISMPAVQLERWLTDGALLKQMFEDAGYNVLITYGDNLIDTQINEINQMIDAGAQLLIICPVDSDSLSPCIEKAHEKNIPIVAYDRLIYHDPNLLAYVSYDNYMVGALQAEYIVDSLDLDNPDNHETFNLEIFSGDSADNNALYFYDGAMDILNPYIQSKKLNVLSNQTSFYSCSISSWSTELASERMEIMLASYYSGADNLDAVLCSNDSIALGVCNAISASYKKSNNVIITGQDCDTNNLEYLKSGKQSMSIYKDLKNEVLATHYVVNMFLNGVSNGEDLSQNNEFDFNIKRNTSSYVSDNVAINSYLLTPTVVTIDNINEVLNN